MIRAPVERKGRDGAHRQHQRHDHSRQLKPVAHTTLYEDASGEVPIGLASLRSTRFRTGVPGAHNSPTTRRTSAGEPLVKNVSAPVPSRTARRLLDASTRRSSRATATAGSM